MTRKMKEFIEHNKSALIISGERLTPEGRKVYVKADFMASDRCRYRFTDGTTRVLLDKDKQSAPDFIPQWSHGV